MPMPQTNVTAFDGINTPTRNDPANWNDRAEDGWARLKPGGDQMNVLAGQMNNMATSANEAAETATTKAGEAAQSAADAAGSASGAAQSAGDASASAEQAAESAAAAAALVNALTASSSTSLTISLGAKTLVTQSGKQFAPGTDLKIADVANAANAMYATVTSYTGTSLQVNVTSVTGSGTIAAWNISVSGQRGPTGATGGVTGGTLEGALWAKKGTDVASGTAPGAVEVWTTGGEFFTLTGSATITGLAAAPQAGAEVRVLVSGTPTLTAGASLVIKGVPSGQSYTCAPGDELDIWAETTTKFRVAITRANGAATADGGLLHVVDQKPNATPGGTNAGNTDTARTLNTVLVSTIAGAQLASNQVTLPMGTYDITARAPFNNVGMNRLTWWNVTDNSPAIYGPSAGGTAPGSAFVSGRVTITAQKVFELRHFTSTNNNSTGLGMHVGASNAAPEVYATLEIRKVA
ncbi:hypothetical protein E7V67_011610 [[Empedobacter] haloabium]|uniref:Minor tail protein n=1 Tax=[Empedobacter] haloabium TaxID=592317 RepID=A0ABZ1USL7_9BURK